MDHNLRSVLEEELAGQSEPPIGDLVESSVRLGRRLRVVRRLKIGAAAVALVGVTGVAGVAGVAVTGRAGLPSAPGGTVAQHAGAGGTGSSTTGPDATATPGTGSGAITPTSDEPLVPATSAGELELLLSLLPAGQTSHYAGARDEPHIQTYLDNGTGPGMIRVSVHEHVPGPGDPGGQVTHLPDGNTATVRQLDNCVQSTVVYLSRPKGDDVQIDIAKCLAWDGKENAAGRQALTAEQAIKIADDPRWGVKLPKSLVDAGNARFPTLPDFG